MRVLRSALAWEWPVYGHSRGTVRTNAIVADLYRMWGTVPPGPSLRVVTREIFGADGGRRVAEGPRDGGRGRRLHVCVRALARSIGPSAGALSQWMRTPLPRPRTSTVVGPMRPDRVSAGAS